MQPTPPRSLALTFALAVSTPVVAGQGFGPQQVITTSANGATSVHAVDLDGDGDVDVLSASGLDAQIAWYENLGSGSFGPEQVITTAAGTKRMVYAADLDGDGDADVVWAASVDKVAWCENLGLGAFGPEQVITTVAYSVQCVYATDLDGDGDVDVLSACPDGVGKVAWYENLGLGAFGPEQVITTPADGERWVYATDLDGDGDADVLSASDNDDKIAWYENLGSGSFGPQQVITTAADFATSVYAEDLDGDADLDVLSASVSDDKVAWYENLSPPSDCNGNGIPDYLDITNGTSTDCNGNGVLDSCELADHPSLDCDGNGVLDSCDIAVGTSLDCDADGILDSCEILAASSLDCDLDGVLDACQITGNPALDLDSNLVLDDCQSLEVSYCPANTNSTGQATRLRVLGSDVPADNDVTLLADCLPSNEFGFFLMGLVPSAIPIGPGVLCLTNPIIRLDVLPGAVLSSGPNAVIIRVLDLTTLPQMTAIQPGDTWNFQLWHRDFDFSTASPSMNFSDGVSVAFN